MTIADLHLNPVAQQACQEWLTLFPTLVFTSGRRSLILQAWAMADNQMQDDNYLIRTYKRGSRLEQWWHDYQASGDRRAQCAALLYGAMRADPTLVTSAHLRGMAVDLKPMVDGVNGQITPEGHQVLAHLRGDTRVAKVLDHEGGLVRWHVEFLPPPEAR